MGIGEKTSRQKNASDEKFHLHFDDSISSIRDSLLISILTDNGMHWRRIHELQLWPPSRATRSERNKETILNKSKCAPIEINYNFERLSWAVRVRATVCMRECARVSEASSRSD